MGKLYFEEELLVPKSRLATIIGKKGSTREQLERLGGIKLKIDSRANTVKIISDDALKLWTARKVIEAIARGFSPEKAQKIFKEGNEFELIDLQDFGAKTKGRLAQLRARVIGTRGRAKRLIQRYTGTDISVFGKTIGIIGPIEGVHLARQAIEMLLSGAKHGSVYNFLRRKCNG